MSMLTPPAQPSSAGRSSPPLEGALREQVIALLRARGIRRAGVFGSSARGSATTESDLDLLIVPPATMSLFAFSELALSLEDLVGRSVDLVTYASLHPLLRASVYASYVELFNEDNGGSRTRSAAPEKAEPL